MPSARTAVAVNRLPMARAKGSSALLLCISMLLVVSVKPRAGQFRAHGFDRLCELNRFR
jgi:hypothetical protein